MSEQFFGERRKATREQLELPGFIHRSDGSILACTVIDMSVFGACILSADLALPNEFTVSLNQSGSVKRHCRVAWRRGFTLGVRFIQNGARS
jgi:hypothetical protein